MNISIIGIDVAKNVFQVHGVNKSGDYSKAWGCCIT